MHSFRLCAFMRQSARLLFVIFPLFAAPIHAETLRLNSVPVEYSIPKGYVSATGEAYDRFHDFINGGTRGDARPSAFVIDGVYAPESVDHLIRISTSADLTTYLSVMHLKMFEDKRFSKKEFADLKEPFWRSKDSDRGELEKRMRQAFEKDADPSRIVLDLGVIEESDAHISNLVLVKHPLNYEGERANVTQAVISRMILSNGKLVHVVLHKIVENKAEATLFKAEALAVFDSMGFQEGGF